jgi:hypothetical protein
MKKSRLFFCLIILLALPFMLNISSADEYDSAVSNTLGINYTQVEETTTGLTSNWEYLSKEWGTILLKNSIVQAIDSFFHKINIVFFVLFAENYSLSLKLLLMVILWVFILFFVNKIFKYYSTFSKPVSFGIAFILDLMFSHIGAISFPVDNLLWLFFGQKTWWAKLIIAIVAIAILSIMNFLVVKYGKQWKENRRKMKDLLNSKKLDSQTKAGEQISDALSKISKG